MRVWHRMGLMTGLFAVAGLAVAAIPFQSARAVEGIERNVAVLRWLDKSTARVQTIRVPVNETVRVENLEMIVRSCVVRPPEEPPESAAFLDISEIRPGEGTSEVFRGWMFASSPALSAMEHPIYDVWVLGCEENDGSQKGDAKGADGKDGAAASSAK